MPVVPTFGGYAPKPDLAQSYLGGLRASMEARQQAQAFQIQQQKLAQEAEQAQMEYDARIRIAEQNARREETQLEMTRAYREAQIGLQQRRLEEQEKLWKIQTDEAAQQSLAMQGYEREAQQLMGGANPLSPEQAYTRAGLKFAPMMGMRPPFQTGSGQGEVPDLGMVSQPPGHPDINFMKTGRYNVSPIQLPKDLSQEKVLPGPVPGTALFNNKVLRIPDTTRGLRMELRQLKKIHDEDTFGPMSIAKQEAGKRKLTDNDKAFISTYRKREAQIKDLLDQIKAIEAKSQPTGTATVTNRFEPEDFDEDELEEEEY